MIPRLVGDYTANLIFDTQPRKQAMKLTPCSAMNSGLSSMLQLITCPRLVAMYAYHRKQKLR